MENLTSENRREFIRWASKIVHEWYVYLEIISRPQAKENYRQRLLLRPDILKKTVVRCPRLINYGLNIPKLPVQHSVFRPRVNMEYHSYTVHIDNQEKAFLRHKSSWVMYFSKCFRIWMVVMLGRDGRSDGGLNMSYTTGCCNRGLNFSSSKSDLDPKSARLLFSSWSVQILFVITYAWTNKLTLVKKRKFKLTEYVAIKVTVGLRFVSQLFQATDQLYP